MYILLNAIFEFKTQKITSKMSKRIYEITELKKICIEVKYNQCVKHTIAKIVKIINA